MADESDDAIVDICSIVIATVALRRRKRRYDRSCWVRSWICSRPRLGGYEALLRDIRHSDERAYQNFCRMTPADYDELLAMVKPFITYQNTNCRKAISADERLAVTLRYLATGELNDIYSNFCFIYLSNWL